MKVFKLQTAVTILVGVLVVLPALAESDSELRFSYGDSDSPTVSQQQMLQPQDLGPDLLGKPDFSSHKVETINIPNLPKFTDNLPPQCDFCQRAIQDSQIFARQQEILELQSQKK